METPSPGWAKIALPGRAEVDSAIASPGVNVRIQQKSTLLTYVPRPFSAPDCPLMHPGVWCLELVIGASRTWPGITAPDCPLMHPGVWCLELVIGASRTWPGIIEWSPSLGTISSSRELNAESIAPRWRFFRSARRPSLFNSAKDLAAAPDHRQLRARSPDDRQLMAFLPQRETTVVVQQREKRCCSAGPSSITSTFRSLSSIVDSVLLRVA